MAVKVIVRTSFGLEWPEIKLGAGCIEALELVVHLLKPASLAAFLLAFWRVGADLGWTAEFIITDGLMRHWQLWVALGISMIASEGYLSRRFMRVQSR